MTAESVSRIRAEHVEVLGLLFVTELPAGVESVTQASSVEYLLSKRCIPLAACAEAPAKEVVVNGTRARAVVPLPLTGLEMNVRRYILGIAPPGCLSCNSTAEARKNTNR